MRLYLETEEITITFDFKLLIYHLEQWKKLKNTEGIFCNCVPSNYHCVRSFNNDIHLIVVMLHASEGKNVHFFAASVMIN